MNSSYKTQFFIVFIGSILLLGIPLTVFFAPIFSQTIAIDYSNMNPLTDPFLQYLSLFAVLLSFLCFLWSCYIIAHGKGYRYWFTLLGLLLYNGLLLLIALPNKLQTDINENKTFVSVSRIFFIIGIFLSLLPALVTALIFYTGIFGALTNLGQIVGLVVEIWLLCSSLIGALYLITGISREVFEHAKHIQKPNHWNCKTFIWTGIAFIFAGSIGFFILSLSLSFFAIGSSQLELPTIPSLSPDVPSPSPVVSQPQPSPTTFPNQ